MLNVKKLSVGALQTNCYIGFDEQSLTAAIIDPGDDAEYIHNVIRDFNLKPHVVVATHVHFDHILAAFEIQHAYKIPFRLHSKDEFLVKRMKESATYFLKREIVEQPPQIQGLLELKKPVKVGTVELEIIETPGHTPGSICLYSKAERILFSGDTLFADGVGRTDFKYSSSDDLHLSLEKLLVLPSDTIVYAGHGREFSLGEIRFTQFA